MCELGSLNMSILKCHWWTATFFCLKNIGTPYISLCYTKHIKDLFYNELNLKEQLLWQVGIGADHTPLPFCSSQRMDSAPCRSYPLSQAYRLVLPIRCPLPPITCPFKGSASVSQLIAEGFQKRTTRKRFLQKNVVAALFSRTSLYFIYYLMLKC